MKMKNKDIIKIGAIIFLVFALIWIFRGGFFREENEDNGGGRRDSQEEIVARETLEGLSIETLEGEPASLEEHEGTPILLTFWEEDSDSRAQLEILDNLLLLLEEEVAFLSVHDPEDREVPHTLVIDQGGMIFREYSGLTTEEVLLADVEELLERVEP